MDFKFLNTILMQALEVLFAFTMIERFGHRSHHQLMCDWWSKKLMCMSVDLFRLIQNSFWSTMHTSDFRASLHCRVIFSQFWFQTYCRIARWGFIGTDNQYCLWGTSWWYLTVSAWEDTKWISSREIYCFSSNWCCWPLSAYTKCWFCGFAI